mmetsp:Transcript_20774/g.79616  ORF Transcript_20774/g.79616 Transcript_20774/m.79616 type:complete len:290 (-) Transcript_20774:256-1125(-)
MRSRQVVVRNGRQQVMGQVVAVVARVDQPARWARHGHVAREAQDAARPQTEVVAHLAQCRDQVKGRGPRQQPQPEERQREVRAGELDQQRKRADPPGHDAGPARPGHARGPKVPEEVAPPGTQREDLAQIARQPMARQCFRRIDQVGITACRAQLHVVLEMVRSIALQRREQQRRDEHPRKGIVHAQRSAEVAMPGIVQDVAQGALPVGDDEQRQRQRLQSDPHHGRRRGQDGGPIKGNVANGSRPVQSQQFAVRAAVALQLRAQFRLVPEDFRMRQHRRKLLPRAVSR